MDAKNRFKVVITAIVVRDGRYLILKRSAKEEKFPNRWTVPGGKLDTDDYMHRPKDTPDYWYNVLEETLRREVREEAGIEIANIRYVTSLADAPEGKDPSLVISCLADYARGQIALSDEMSDAAWVTLEEAKRFDLIEGIGEEIAMAEAMRNGRAKGEWR
ncbi:NUDIX domain-containing protein [Candidatus Parcubacteria bacterium]|nr:MAG: NUDIX domain-containing protein [Candidatus Parcubacteria bacterium]